LFPTQTEATFGEAGEQSPPAQVWAGVGTGARGAADAVGGTIISVVQRPGEPAGPSVVMVVEQGTSCGVAVGAVNEHHGE
jgi:hypothetical protein